MSGIFVEDGASLRIVGLKLRLGEGTPSVEHQGIEMTTEMWMHWLRIGLDHLDTAEQARANLKAAFEAGDDPTKAEALVAETRAGMVALTAAAFAIDAFYASTLERVAVPIETQAAWRKNGTSRAARVVEVVKLAYAIKGPEMKDLATGIREVFKFRDWAVHPPAGFRPVYLHPV